MGKYRNLPVQPRAQAALDAIVAAVDVVVLEVGPDEASTVRLAKAAGVSVGSLYRFFTNKLEVFEEYIERYREALAEQSAQFLQDPPDLDDNEKINRALVTRSAEMLAAHPAFAALRLWKRPDDGEYIAASIRAQETAMVEWLLSSNPTYVTDQADVTRTAKILIETTMTLLAMAPTEEPERAEFVEEVILLCTSFVEAKALRAERTSE